MNQIRPAAVAGAFFIPGNEQVLHRDLDTLLAQARPALGPLPKALIVPHAGYIYSGPIAANAYRRLQAGPRAKSRA